MTQATDAIVNQYHRPSSRRAGQLELRQEMRAMLLHPAPDSLNVTNNEAEHASCSITGEQVQPALSDDRVTALLSAKETARLELKRVSGKMVSKALETICAFANSNGGTLILGLADPSLGSGANRIYGIEENPEAVDELRRKISTHFDPPGIPIRDEYIAIVRSNGSRVHLLMLHVDRSEHVHSIVGDGTWTRLGASNCQMTARQITELAYKRGDRSAEDDCIEMDCSLLDTPAWRAYANSRGLMSGSIEDQLTRVGLGEVRGETVQPRRAAVLLFAEDPGGHQASAGARSDVRLLVYAGTQVENVQIPNLRKLPRAFCGPLIQLIDDAVRTVENELAEGLRLAGSGFEARLRIPTRVVKEAIVNAVIHRDYRLNRDIFIRIFNNRIEIESPGGLPGAITAENIRDHGSKARNPLIARALFSFPVRPNIDAGEGVRMMFSEMERAGLYAPLYRESSCAAGDSVTVVLLSDLKPPLWDLISDWIDRNGAISNAVVCRLGGLNTVKASRVLKKWVELGLLHGSPDRGRKLRVYAKSVANIGLFAPLDCK